MMHNFCFLKRGWLCFAFLFWTNYFSFWVSLSAKYCWQVKYYTACICIILRQAKPGTTQYWMTIKGYYNIWITGVSRGVQREREHPVGLRKKNNKISLFLANFDHSAPHSTTVVRNPAYASDDAHKHWWWGWKTWNNNSTLWLYGTNQHLTSTRSCLLLKNTTKKATHYSLW